MTLYEGDDKEKRDDCFIKLPESKTPMDDSDDEMIFHEESPKSP